MKKRLLFGILLFVVSLVQAQNKLSEEKRKEFEAQKVAFFTQELDLTPAEAAAFWPLYNEMRKKTEAVDGEMRKKAAFVKDGKNLSEDQYREAVVKMLEAEQKMQQIKDEYFQKMMKAVPPSKVWKLRSAEHKFRRQLFDKLRKECGSKPDK